MTKLPDLLDAVAPALDRDEFLQRALEYAIRKSGADGGSIFAYERATCQLRLRMMRDPRNPSSAVTPDVVLSTGEGVVGEAFRSDALTTVVSQPRLTKLFVVCSSTHASDLRTIASAVVLAAHDDPRAERQAVVCLDYLASGGPAELSADEQRRFEDAAREIASPAFASALRRVTFQQAIVDIQTAGQRTAALRHEVGAFLGALQGAFRAAGRPEPVTGYLQLVDRRRRVVRTIQGFGQPLSFQVSLSHPLESDDIQAVVVRERCPLIIAGFDASFDPEVHAEYDHARFVRLWLPLFPFPMASLCARSGQTPEQALASVLAWEPAREHRWTFRSRPERSLRREGRWTFPGVEPDAQPPERLVWGTLELGYVAGRDGLALEPVTRELANWAAVQAYTLSHELFHATLPGVLDAIGVATAEAASAARVSLTVAMPDWSAPEQREFGQPSVWPVAVPRDGEPVSPPPRPPVQLRFDGREAASKTDRLLDRYVDQSVRVALRLDDHVADQYVLFEARRPDSKGERRASFVGTHYPEPDLPEILSEIARESGALSCTYVLFERPANEPGPPRPVAPPTTWTLPGAPATETPSLVEARLEAARSGCAQRNTHGEPSSLLLPLELSDGVVAVLDLRFSAQAAPDDLAQREIEGRVARWVYRLSLRRLALANRYAALMRILRRQVVEARRAAQDAQNGRRLRVMAQRLLSDVASQLRAPAAVLTIYHEHDQEAERQGRQQVERFWYVAPSSPPPRALAPHGHDDAIVVGEREGGPVYEALRLGRIMVYRPGDAARARDAAPVAEALLDRARAWRASGERERAALLERVVAIAREEAESATTTLVIPVHDPQALAGATLRAGLTLFLADEHYLSHVQERLLVEFGELVADSLAQARARDTEVFRGRHEQHLRELRSSFALAQDENAVVGALLRSLGQADEGAWDLADDAVLWVPALDGRELVARSGRGRGLSSLGDQTVVGRPDHPLAARPEWSASDMAGPSPTPLRVDAHLFPVRREAETGVVQAYARAMPDRGWLLCAPVFEPDGRRAAVIDLLLAAVPRPEEFGVLKDVLRRLAIAFGVALESVRGKSLIEFETRLMRATREALATFRAQEAFAAIVQAVRAELDCAHCDLYVERDGRMLLHASTRAAVLSDAERASLWVIPQAGPEPLGHCLARRQAVLAHARTLSAGVAHLSPALQRLLDGDHAPERLVVPLTSDEEQLDGMLAVYGPLRPPTVERNGVLRTLKVAQHLNARHQRRLTDLARLVHHLAVMANVIERQSWFVDELQHSVGQPLQIVRGMTDEILRDLQRGGVAVRALREGLTQAYDVAHAARENLAAFAKISQQLRWDLEPVAVHELVRECCALMRSKAREKGCTVDDLKVRALRTVFTHGPLLRVALINLLENAIKYSYRDKAIRVVLGEHNGLIRLMVHNFGVGIPHRDLQRIFEPYFRSRVPDRVKQRDGSGIGLFMATHAVKRVHEGRVRVASKPAGGRVVGDTADAIANVPHNTTFTIELDRNRLEALAAEGAERTPHE